jgi:hypothetical protein
MDSFSPRPTDRLGFFDADFLVAAFLAMLEFKVSGFGSQEYLFSRSGISKSLGPVELGA